MEKQLQYKHFRSRYIVDVDIEPTYVQLIDSSHAYYYIDIRNKAVMDQFKLWFKTWFIKGVNQHLTVFAYSKHEVDGEVKMVVEKFFEEASTTV